MTSAPQIEAAALPRLDRARFMALFGGVFEHSPWVAEKAWKEAPFDRVEALHTAMMRAVRQAEPERQLALIRAHPDLAGKAAVAGEITAESQSEQAGAGLDRCTAEEFARFQELNRAYKERFGFPYILAVRGHDRAGILADFAQRLDNGPEAEFERALEEIARIARFRLADLIAP